MIRAATDSSSGQFPNGPSPDWKELRTSRWPQRVAHVVPVTALALLSACGKEATPTAPTAQTSFLTGTIQVNPGDPGAPPPSTGQMTWASEAVPQTNLQTFGVAIQSTHPWLTMEPTASTALTPSNTPPAQISTQGDFPSPRGCRGTFGSAGTANATRIEANFTGTDCQVATFSGTFVLTKDLAGETGGRCLLGGALLDASEGRTSASSGSMAPVTAPSARAGALLRRHPAAVLTARVHRSCLTCSHSRRRLLSQSGQPDRRSPTRPTGC